MLSAAIFRTRCGSSSRLWTSAGRAPGKAGVVTVWHRTSCRRHARANRPMNGYGMVLTPVCCDTEHLEGARGREHFSAWPSTSRGASGATRPSVPIRTVVRVIPDIFVP